MKESKCKQRIKLHKKLPLKRALLSSRLRCQQHGLLQTTQQSSKVGWPPRYPYKIICKWEAWVPCASKLLKLWEETDEDAKQHLFALVLICFELQEWSYLLLICSYSSFYFVLFAFGRVQALKTWNGFCFLYCAFAVVMHALGVVFILCLYVVKQK